jgi:hypothetical protein
VMFDPAINPESSALECESNFWRFHPGAEQVVKSLIVLGRPPSSQTPPGNLSLLATLLQQ